MAAVGLVGGLGPESTIDYYRRILQAWEQEEPASMPSIVIDSLDVQRALRLVADDRSALVDYLSDSVARLAAAGVDFVAITANTPHIVFDELLARAPVPLLSIVETCAQAVCGRGCRRPLLLGTRFTMAAPFYPEVCARSGIDVLRPESAECEWIHERYVGELLKGVFRDDTRAGFAAIVQAWRDEHGIDSVTLGGTELPLLMTGDTAAGLPAFDTTALHVSAIVDRLRRGAG
jgi:aspartate racemase